MISLLVIVSATAALAGCLFKGMHWVFRWIYLPVLILVPISIELELVGVPNLAPRRAVAVGMVCGAFLLGNTKVLVPRWCRFDLLALTPVLFFSISYGMSTGFAGFYHQLAVCSFDWAVPYVLTRSMICDREAIRKFLLPVAIASCVLAFLTVYECRMATRLAAKIWVSAGFDVPIWGHFHGWRWGLLRPVASFSNPLYLGSFFATVTPLMALWALLDSRRRWMAVIAGLACATACVACLSRGPILVLATVLVVFGCVALRVRIGVVLALGALLVILPFLVDIAAEQVAITQADLQTRGNTSSGRYRIAILLLYAKDILHVGFWGNPRLVGAEYRAASSIDNSYLYFFLVSGWMGGSVFLALVIGLLRVGARQIRRTVGQERKIRTATLASFVAMAGCMANVWFAPDYAPFFWITAALVLNARAWSSPGRHRLPHVV